MSLTVRHTNSPWSLKQDMMPDSVLTSLNLSDVDFNSVDEVNDFAIQLMNVGNSLGVLSGEKRLQSREAVAIYQATKGWVNTVKKQFLTMSPAEALQLVDTYEIMHRIAFQCSANAGELDRIKLAAFDAMLHSDKNVDEYIMFRVIRNEVSKRNKAFFDKPLTWSCISEERWHKEAVEGFDRNVLTDYDIISRVTILLESDLFAYEGRNQDQFKQYLAEEHRHYLTKYTAPDCRTVHAIDNFQLVSARYF